MAAQPAPTLGWVSPGRPVRLDFAQASPTRWVLDIPAPGGCGSATCFLLPGVALPPGGGLAFFWALPPFENYTALGVLTAAAPSATWNTGWPATPEVAAAPSVRVGVSLESADVCANLAAARAAGAEARAAGFAQALAADAGRFLGSFAQVLPGVGERLVLPPTALDAWLKRVADRFRADPEFFRKGE